MNRNLKDHKFPTRRQYSVCVSGGVFANILTLRTLQVPRSDTRKGLYYSDAGVYFYTRPLSDINQLEVGVYQ